MKKVKVGIAGFGRIVELVHVPMMNSVEEIQISGVFDITPNRSEMAGKRNFNVHPTFEDLIASDCDLVLIATPPNSHAELASAALKAGKNVLIEKPVTVSLAQAEELKRLSAQYGGFVSVFHNRRFTPDYKLVKSIFQENRLGTPTFVERRYHAFGAPIWFGVKSFDPLWRVKPEMGGGALMDWGVHLVDQLIDLRLPAVESVRSFVASLPGAEGSAEDFVQAHLRLESGLVYSISINFRSDAAQPLWIVGGERQTLVVQNEKEAFLMEKGKVVEAVEMEKASRKDGVEIYKACVRKILYGEALAVTLEEAIEGFKIIDRIKAGSD